MWIAKHFGIWVDSVLMTKRNDITADSTADTTGVWSERRYGGGGGPATVDAACDRWPRRAAVAEQAGPVVHAVFRLSRLNRMMIGGALRELGLAPGQELLLMQLWDRDGCSQSDLVDRLGLDPSTVTKMLQRLERDGWVCRSPSSDDGRVTLVGLTAAGRGLRGDVTRLWGELERETVRSLSDDERQTLLALLARMEQSLHASGTAGVSEPRGSAEVDAEAQPSGSCD
jgi:MarR family transcriptional regulator, organic hydroperoxide resistance regulator